MGGRHLKLTLIKLLKTLLVAVKRGTLTERHYAKIRQAQAYADALVKNGASTRPIKIVVVEID